ncbi:MAG: TetR/AcrR family transcriptional regulator [Dehalococcoidia bacterium]|nr:TetR/AcrR family transcriptional regulator [Dehalococcoidia bacterium]
MTIDAARKHDLLDRLVDYAFEHGLSDLSLRPLAAAAGTSARMLIYHFGSKEQLTMEVLQAARDRHWRRVVLEAGAGDPPPGLLAARTWEGLAADDMRPYLRLFYEGLGMAFQGREPFTRLLDGAVTEPLAFLCRAFQRAGLDRDVAGHEATLLHATIGGLLLDLLATGDRARCDDALAVYVHGLEARMPALSAAAAAAG